jgi:EAL domain-containing protein (putative c-di-GMP-specific phosphodiesterase class I)
MINTTDNQTNKCNICIKRYTFIDEHSLLYNKERMYLDFKNSYYMVLISIKDRNSIIHKSSGDFREIKKNLEMYLNNSLKEIGTFLYKLKLDYATLLSQKNLTKFIEFIEKINKEKPFGQEICIKVVISKINEETPQLSLDGLDNVLNYINNEKKYLAHRIVTPKEFHKILNEIKHERKVYLEIEYALKNDNIILYKQGISDINNNINKFECLVRMNVNGEIKSPDYFLDISKKYGLYNKISKCVINKAFEYFKDKDSYFSINLDNSDFSDFSVLKCLIKNLKTYTKNKFIIEIIETEELKLKKIQLIHKIRNNYGILISIDDFGSGHSNLMSVIEYKANYLKIDGSIIKNIHLLKSNQKVLEHVCKLAKDFNLKLVAEFVSSQEIRDCLSKYDIDYFQGYLFSKPIALKG